MGLANAQCKSTIGGVMRVIYVILATAGWVWTAVVLIFLWRKLRPGRAQSGIDAGCE
jgi:hypothetical protein